jgi:glycosyltransferase involved in cell wall biosynthesis
MLNATDNTCVASVPTMNATDNGGVSVVVPVYQSTKSLPELVQRVGAVVQGRYEIVFVDDGSQEETWRQLRNLSSDAVRCIRLSRNYGQHAALLAGIRAARYSTIITMDDDLQHPPEEIPRLLSALESGVDVVYGVEKQVRQSFWRRATSSVSKRLIATLLGAGVARQMTAFRAFRAWLRDGFNENIGPGVSIDALLAWSTSRMGTVEVDHHTRKYGRSNYGFTGLVKYLFDIATGFSIVPLRLAVRLGLATIVFGLTIFVYVIVRVIVHGSSVPGFPFIAASLAVFSGVQLLILGLLGEYIGRMHFRVMNRPSYLIAERTDQNPVP